MECPICFEAIENERAYATFCGHIFCECLINRRQSFCPICVQVLDYNKVHKIYFPASVQRAGEVSMDDAIVQSLATNLASEQKKTEAKFQEISTALENLQLTFSKSDSIFEAYRAENKDLKEEVERLKNKLSEFEKMLKSSAKESEEKMLDTPAMNLRNKTKNYSTQ